MPADLSIFAVANQKGGVGKTSTVVNLGAYLGALGSRVLLVDCDPQANTTSFLGESIDEPGLYDALLDDTAAADVIRTTNTSGVALLGATPDLAAVEVELLHEERPSYRLRDLLAPLKREYDYIFL